MGTLYVVGVPESDPNDITLRARRILEEVALVVAGDIPGARRLLACYDMAKPLAATTRGEALLAALEAGDVGLLCEGRLLSPSGPALALIRAAVERGFAVVPVPGPNLPIAALLISGLPTDSFVYLGELPPQPAARRDLLASVAAERRTLVIPESACRLPEALTILHDVLGDRSLVMVTASDRGTKVVWRGALGEAAEHLATRPIEGSCILVIGGAQEQVTRWDEDRLRTAVQARLSQGLGAREISRQLAAESGWPRREIYRQAAGIARFLGNE